MKISVHISFEGNTDKASGFFEEVYEGEENEGCLSRLAQAIVYAIPKQHFPHFEILEICADGKSIGHGENS